MIDSLFTRFRSAADAQDCEALGDDPEWNELIAWAGVKTEGAQGAGGDRNSREGDAADEADADANPPSDAPADSEDWDAVIAMAKAPEDWDAVIAMAKATTPAPQPIDELSSMRARQAHLTPSPGPSVDLGLDAWDIALLRAKQA